MFDIKASKQAALRPQRTISRGTAEEPKIKLGSSSAGLRQALQERDHKKATQVATRPKVRNSDADFTSLNLSGSMPLTGQPNTNVSGNALTLDTDPMLQGFTPQDEASAVFQKMYRDIYLNDSVGGSGADMLSFLPFSEFSLGGISGKTKIENDYMEMIETLNIRTLLPQVSLDYLVSGEHISSLLYNKEEAKLTDIMAHNVENTSVIPLPFLSQDPIITVTFDQHVKAAFSSDSQRIKRLEKQYGKKVIEQIATGTLELEPLSTIFISRNTFSHFGRGTSWFRRILPYYLIEKNLFRGTLVESMRRQRGILHITAGDGDWEPTMGDLEFVTELFMNADSDPLGATIATRMGISTEELRQGGDFWKSTDFQDSVMGAKLRALGISESVLSAEASYQCLVGESLVATENGLVRIDSFGSNEEKRKRIDLKVGGRFKPEIAATWLYSGHAPVYEVSTVEGFSNTATKQHPHLAFDAVELRTKWVETTSLRVGDMLCVNPIQVTRKTKLKLNLSKVETLKKAAVSKMANLKSPKAMTENLAYALGILVAEGHFEYDENGRPCRTVLTNSDRAILNKYSTTMSAVFGKNLNSSEYMYHPKGLDFNINSNVGTTNQDCYTVKTASIQLAHWLGELGLYVGGNAEGVSASYHKIIPWSILEADVNSQYAFLAAYLDGDGSVRNAEVIYHSASSEILKKIQIMLAAMGHFSKLSKNGLALRIRNLDAKNLLAKLSKYMATGKHFEFDEARIKFRNSYGIPTAAVSNLLLSRKVSHNKYGITFIDDSGKAVHISDGMEQYHRQKLFLHDQYDAGIYDTYLQQIKKISKSTYDKLIELFKLRYRFIEVSGVAYVGKRDVYDLSMRKGVEPAFCSNGVVVHNTGEAGMTIFVETMRTHRETIVRKFLYDKLFPLFSLIRGYTVGRSGNISTRAGLINEISQEEAMTRLNDGSKLLVPTVHWAKTLKPEGDSAMLEILGQMGEKGIPVPIRMFAAAGGINMEELLKHQEEDLKLREKMKVWTDALKKFAPAEESESASGALANGNLSVMASSDPTGKIRSSVLSRTGRKSILDRDWTTGTANEGDLYATGKTGKRKHIIGQARENSRINNRIVKSARAVLSKPNTKR